MSLNQTKADRRSMHHDLLASLVTHLDRPDVSIWKFLGEGFSSTVYEYRPEAVVVRIARSADASRRISRMAKWLLWLSPQLPFSIPGPSWRLHSGIEPSLPFGAIGYPKLSGAMLQPETTSDGTVETLAAALVCLHNLELPEVTSPLFERPDRVHAVRLDQFESIRPLLVHHLSPADWTRIERWQRSPVSLPTRKTIVHGDFWHENILIEPMTGRLTGVIDWEGVTIGDPAQNLVLLRYLGANHANRVLSEYLPLMNEDLEDLEPRLTWWWQCRDFGGIYLAMQMNDQDEIEDGIHKLRNGPILNP